ncbi:class I SAM-dependent methyltransferase [Nocardioides jensenii]|uniref:class I SAM-dependent methyltransferase n=1 Tax=Nocardioides jensenii TaxID=1843 RepID=UPI00082F94FD|nr:class I SAM-dependent methyltransferase [Nocardioides jensenii]
MSLHDTVKDHYGHADLADVIVRALSANGVDTAALKPTDLAPVDQLHAGFAPATEYVLDALAVGPETRLFDVGCGIGGGSRMAAARGARVVGIDLTPEFIVSAQSLTDLTGLSDRITFVNSSADALDLPDASFDAAMMIHVGMNISDKRAVFTEVRRLLAPGGRFAVFEQMRAGAGDLTYPLPWALDESSSFVATPEEYVADLEAAGFTIDSTEDRTSFVAGSPPRGSSSPGLSPAVIFGPEFMTRIGNNVAASDDGILGAFLIVARC